MQMAGKINQPTDDQIGEIGTIRNILMGQQMAEYATSFKALHEELATTRSELQENTKTLATSTDERFAKLEKQLDERLNKLEAMLMEHVNRLDQKLIELSKHDKQDLGQMLAEISKRLMTT